MIGSVGKRVERHQDKEPNSILTDFLELFSHGL